MNRIDPYKPNFLPDLLTIPQGGSKEIMGLHVHKHVKGNRDPREFSVDEMWPGRCVSATEVCLLLDKLYDERTNKQND